MRVDNILKELDKKKTEGLAEAEALRKEIVRRLDEQIDALYAKRDLITEVWKKKLQFKKYKSGVWKNFWQNKMRWNIRYILGMPFIYGMLIPALFLHATTEIYHHVCFRLYGIPLVSPKGYFIFDRKKLPYLNWLEKINCFYCSYFNGLIAYIQEIAGRTERYWCPIKHARRMMVQHSHYANFVDYDDAEHVREEWERLRKFTGVQE